MLDDAQFEMLHAQAQANVYSHHSVERGLLIRLVVQARRAAALEGQVAALADVPSAGEGLLKAITTLAEVERICLANPEADDGRCAEDVVAVIANTIRSEGAAKLHPEDWETIEQVCFTLRDYFREHEEASRESPQPQKEAPADDRS